MPKQMCVYMMANPTNTVVYVGVTGNLLRRVLEHKQKKLDGFTKRYNVTKLVYYEVTENPESAILREKEIKKWRREKKNRLIAAENPAWRDLFDDFLR